MAATPPYYEDIRWPGVGGLRVPQEAAPASLRVYKEVDLGSASGTVTLTPQQAGASLITATPSGALTVNYPGLMPGLTVFVENLSTASANSITVGAIGATATSATVGSSTNAIIAHSTAANGIVSR
jgi:hypothetical protein